MSAKRMQIREEIQITGASENNLKRVSVNIPKERLVVVAGVSGSGKSSRAFDTVAAESSREWQATYPLYLRNRLPHFERPAVESIRNLTPSVVVDQRPVGAKLFRKIQHYRLLQSTTSLFFTKYSAPE